MRCAFAAATLLILAGCQPDPEVGDLYHDPESVFSDHLCEVQPDFVSDRVKLRCDSPPHERVLSLTRFEYDYESVKPWWQRF